MLGGHDLFEADRLAQKRQRVARRMASRLDAVAGEGFVTRAVACLVVHPRSTELLGYEGGVVVCGLQLSLPGQRHDGVYIAVLVPRRRYDQKPPPKVLETTPLLDS